MNDVTPATFFFPAAGSFGGEFQPLIDALSPAAWLVRYPGRYGRDFGVPAESFEGVVRACVEQVATPARAKAVLFGHSFGAYVAYGTALSLQEAGSGVSALVASGASAPGRLTVPERATGTLADAATYLDSVDPNALADAPSDEWREVVLETAVQDLRLLKMFGAAGFTAARLECLVVAVRGEADPLTSDATAVEWKHSTDGAFSLHVFPGGHSQFLRSPDCVSWYREIRDGLH